MFYDSKQNSDVILSARRNVLQTWEVENKRQIASGQNKVHQNDRKVNITC